MVLSILANATNAAKPVHYPTASYDSSVAQYPSAVQLCSTFLCGDTFKCIIPNSLRLAPLNKWLLNEGSLGFIRYRTRLTVSNNPSKPSPPLGNLAVPGNFLLTLGVIVVADFR